MTRNTLVVYTFYNRCTMYPKLHINSYQLYIRNVLRTSQPQKFFTGPCTVTQSYMIYRHTEFSVHLTSCCRRFLTPVRVIARDTSTTKPISACTRPDTKYPAWSRRWVAESTRTDATSTWGTMSSSIHTKRKEIPPLPIVGQFNSIA